MKNDDGTEMTGAEAEASVAELADIVEQVKARRLAELIRNETIGGCAPMYALECFEVPDFTAEDVRREVIPMLTEIIHACSDVIGDGFYPTDRFHTGADHR